MARTGFRTAQIGQESSRWEEAVKITAPAASTPTLPLPGLQASRGEPSAAPPGPGEGVPPGLPIRPQRLQSDLRTKAGPPVPAPEASGGSPAATQLSRPHDFHRLYWPPTPAGPSAAHRPARWRRGLPRPSAHADTLRGGPETSRRRRQGHLLFAF